MPNIPTQWYTLQRGGYALIASGGLLLGLIVWALFVNTNTNPNAVAPALFILFTAVAYALLLVGLPAIYAMQPPADRVAQAGFLCIAAGAALSVIDLLLALVNVNLPGALVLAYVVLQMFGFLLVGWVTARARVFPSWVGWTLLAAGAVMLLLGPVYAEILLLISLIGFGVTIVRAVPPTAAGSGGDAPLDEPSVEPQA